jgi:hypothetical protein
VASVDDVKEATILTDDKSSFGDDEFISWVNEGKSEKKISNRTEKRNAFYKLGFNKNHIPCQGNYEKTRKTRLPQWDNPSFDWPPRMPRPTMHRG